MQFQIKPLRAADKDRVLEISAEIWEGDDYIPQVFEQWLNESNSDFVGLWADDKLIAFNRLIYLNPQTVWLEGLRKDQSTAIRGVTARLVEYHLAKIKDNPKITSIRFSTYFSNIASIKFHEKRGFTKILELSLKELKWENNHLPKFPSKTDLNAKFSYNIKEIVQFMEKSRYLKGSAGFIVDSWTAYPYQADLFEEFIKNRQVLVLSSAGAIEGLAIFSVGKEKQSLWLNFLEANSSEILNDLLRELVKEAQRKNLQKLELVIPTDWYDLDLFGFNSWEQEKDFYIYELQE